MFRLFPLVLLAGVLPAQSVPSGFTIDTLVSGPLNQPNDFCFLPDGRALIANADGTVTLHANGATALVGTVPNVELTVERGLLSLAADPNFPNNGYVYAWYASTQDDFLHLDRFTCTGSLANASSTNLTFAASSRRVVLGTVPDLAEFHNGGSLRFGPDGMLYLSIGDDGDSCVAQNVASQVGCLLRMNVAGLPAGGSTTLPSFATLDPGNNPLSSANDFSQLVIGHGLRNPFRMEIDPLTGNIYIGDVGESAVEEYSEYVYVPGALALRNFGWPFREGDIPGPSCGGTPPAGMIDPILAMPHAASWGSIIGGALYRNLGASSGFGAAYEGNAFCLDFGAGLLRRIQKVGGTWMTPAAVPGQPSPSNWGTGFTHVTSLRLGPDGSLWYTQRSWTGGELCRIRKINTQNTVVAISGGTQRTAIQDVFAQPVVARLLDAQGNPVAGGLVNFAVSGPATVTSTNPATTDANGHAQVTVAATANGGAIMVTATSVGAANNATFSLYARKLTTAFSAPLFSLQVANQTSASPAQTPYIVLLSLPGSPRLASPIGAICIDPGYALAVVLEDGIGLFGGVSYSGTGAIGNPSLSKLYSVPNGLLNGQLVTFQAFGFDMLTGWFRTNCTQVQF
mgnify:CR=1 FL=1